MTEQIPCHRLHNFLRNKTIFWLQKIFFVQCFFNIYKAMLKLTNSFSRYPRLKSENINHKIKILKQLNHFSCPSKTCVTSTNQQELLRPTVFTGVQWRLLANIRKRTHTKKSFEKSNETRNPKQMSEQGHPTLQQVSYGGQFQVSEENPPNEWHKSSDSIKKPCNIPPNFRTWESVGKKNQISYENIRFTVMSYNVLAQYLLEWHPYLYTGCSPENLKWKIRAAKLYDEILSLSPDILCLQEVQVSHLSSFYSRFEQMGYHGIFKQKTGHRQDGCAIYFKRALFELQDHISVEYYQPELPILNRDNIGLIMKLSPKSSPSTPIVVATTHLLYNPKRTDVRLAQLQVLLAEIDRFAFNEASYLPIILTGDFNSTPDSAVLQLLDRGHVRANSLRDNSDWKKIGVTDNCQHLSVYLNRQIGASTDISMIKLHNSENSNLTQNTDHEQSYDYHEMFNGGTICHPLQLSSVYHKVKNDGDFEATTFQDYWVTVDYIYFSCCSTLNLVDRLRLPSAKECEVLGKLPNDHYGSDHLALAATFELRPLAMSSL